MFILSINKNWFSKSKGIMHRIKDGFVNIWWLGMHIWMHLNWKLNIGSSSSGFKKPNQSSNICGSLKSVIGASLAYCMATTVRYTRGQILLSYVRIYTYVYIFRFSEIFFDILHACLEFVALYINSVKSILDAQYAHLKFIEATTRNSYWQHQQDE